MNTRPATIKDIASRLGLDPSSVSRALNGHDGVSEDTRRRVREAADSLGYVINLSARQMVRRQGMLVALLVPDIKNDFHSTMASIMAKHCRETAFQMVLGNTDDDPGVEERQVRALAGARAAGIVITPTPNPTETTKKLLRSLPAVQLLRRVSGIAGAAVCMEDAAGIRDATRHLLALGHRRIAYIGTRSDISVGGERLRGFIEAHREAGAATHKQLVMLAQPRSEFGHDAARALLALPRPPTALLVGSTQLTPGALQAIAERGVTVPDALSVVGYGDPDWCSLLSPALTTVRLPVEEMAKSAVQALFQRIDGKAPPRPRETMRGTLVVRKSTCAAPAGSFRDAPRGNREK